MRQRALRTSHEEASPGVAPHPTRHAFNSQPPVNGVHATLPHAARRTSSGPVIHTQLAATDVSKPCVRVRVRARARVRVCVCVSLQGRRGFDA